MFFYPYKQKIQIFFKGVTPIFGLFYVRLSNIDALN